MSGSIFHSGGKLTAFPAVPVSHFPHSFLSFFLIFPDGNGGDNFSLKKADSHLEKVVNQLTLIFFCSFFLTKAELNPTTIEKKRQQNLPERWVLNLPFIVFWPTFFLQKTYHPPAWLSLEIISIQWQKIVLKDQNLHKNRKNGKYKYYKCTKN